VSARILAWTLPVIGALILGQLALSVEKVGVSHALTSFSAEAEVVGGDLTDLTFSATGDLPATFVMPLSNASVGLGSSVEASTVAGAGIELTVNGVVVPRSHVGERMVSKTTGETHYIFYGLDFKSGTNDLGITGLGAHDERGTTLHETVFGPGPAISLQGGPVGEIHAGSPTPGMIRVVLLDQWSRPASPELLRATVVSGDVTLGVSVPSAVGSTVDAKILGDAAPGVPVSNSVDGAVSATPGPASSPDLPSNLQVMGSIPSSVVANPTSVRPSIGAAHYEARSDDDGVFAIPVTPGLTSGDAVVRIDTATGLSLLVHCFIEPYLRKPIVIGLVTGGIGSIPGSPGSDPTEADGANSKRARVALYASGAVLQKALLTFAYDTANTLDQTTAYGPFTSNPDDRPYLTYGDSSTRRDDALSRDHMFARFEQGGTSLTWGEFEAKTSSDATASIGGLNLLVSGAKFETGNAHAHASVFTAKNDIAYGRQTFTPTGLSTLSVLLHSDIVVGSDIVDLVTLDRHTGIVLQEQSLTPNVDYTLDDGTGQIQFINVPMPYDVNFNPQQILIRYQYQGVGSGAETTGGRVSTTLGKSGSIQIGAGYANSSQGTGNVSVFSQNVSGHVGSGLWDIEHMSTSGALQTTDALPSSGAVNFGSTGYAWQAALATNVGANKFCLHFDSTSAGYNNPFGGLATPGLLSYNATYSRSFAGGSLDASVEHDRNIGVGFENSESSAQIAAKKHVGKKLSLGAGIAIRQYAAGNGFVGVPIVGDSVNAVATPVPVSLISSLAGGNASSYANPDGTQTQGSLSAGYKFSSAVDLAISHLFSLGGQTTGNTSQSANSTTAEFGVSFAKQGRAYIREIWDGMPDQAFAASSVPLTGVTQSTRSTAFGFEHYLGKSTSLDTEYVVQNAGSGTDLYSAIGVKEDFKLRKNLKGSVHVEKANAVGTGLSGFNVYDVSMGYTNTAFKATSAYELRTGSLPGSTLSLGAVGALSDNLSLIGSMADADTVGFSTNQDRVSLAYRPLYNDDAVTLFGYERESGNDVALGEHTETLSLEHLQRPKRTLVIAGRAAYKLDGDPYYAAHTYLLGLRATQKIGGPNGRFDLGIDSRYLGAGGGIVGANAFGYAVESGATVGNSMRLGLGYNFASAPDPDLSIAPKRKGVYLTFTSSIDSIFGWGKH